MVDQRQMKLPSTPQRSQVNLVSEQQEVRGQAGLTQQEEAVRTQNQVRLPDVQQRDAERLTASGLTERQMSHHTVMKSY